MSEDADYKVVITIPHLNVESKVYGFGERNEAENFIAHLHAQINEGTDNNMLIEGQTLLTTDNQGEIIEGGRSFHIIPMDELRFHIVQIKLLTNSSEGYTTNE